MAVRNIKDLQIGEGTLYLNNRDVGALTDARFTAEIEKVVHQSGMPLPDFDSFSLFLTPLISETLDKSTFYFSISHFFIIL